jgi:exonuclease III
MKGDPTAIDWILVCENTDKHVRAVGLDTEPLRMYVGSDHVPVFVDLDIKVA